MHHAYMKFSTILVKVLYYLSKERTMYLIWINIVRKLSLEFPMISGSSFFFLLLNMLVEYVSDNRLVGYFYIFSC